MDRELRARREYRVEIPTLDYYRRQINCQFACPVNTDARGYVIAIAEGDFEEAYRIARRPNPLAGVCGRICTALCEDECRRGVIDEPVAIRALKRFAQERGGADQAMEMAPPSGKRVAVIGSGPAGLAAAHDLALLGHQVTIFEADARAGGALTAAIPEYRLPTDVLDRDIQRITNMGVRIQTNARVGEDVPFETLQKDFAAVFLAMGAWRNRQLGIPGEDADGVLDPLQFLRRAKQGAREKLGEHVVVVGGGNVAIDAARTALRLGSRRVSILYRRTRQEMPADPVEVEEALREGVRISYLVSPLSIGVQNGKVKCLKCAPMRLGGIDSSGRRKPVPLEGEELVVEADTVIPAIGQQPDVSFLPGKLRAIVSDRGLIGADRETFATDRPGIFAGGDAVLGGATVAEAMAAGKWAAQSIHQYITGQPVKREYDVTRPTVQVGPVELSDDELDQLLEQRRPPLPARPCASRVKSFAEVELGLDEAAAVSEAKRCLRCDLTAQE